MKKLIILLVLMLSIAAQAQEPSQHMKFMGIPMDCDVESFAKKLEKEKGLVRGDFGNTDDPMLKGDFSSYKDCMFIVSGKKLVSVVGVLFPKQESFNLLLSQFQTLKKRLQTKYGTPIIDEESFNDYEPSTDYGKMRELREGNAKFVVSYELAEGQIQLQMCSVEPLYGYLQLMYVDFKNAIEDNNKALDDL